MEIIHLKIVVGSLKIFKIGIKEKMSSKLITDAAQPIQSKWQNIQDEFQQRTPGFHLVPTETYRSPEEQFTLYQKGRTQSSTGEWLVTNKDEVVTNVDGYKNIGAHNYHPSRAIDVSVVNNQTGKIIWEESYYHCLVEISNSNGLESGGSWKSLKDWPHIQIPNFQQYKGQ